MSSYSEKNIIKHCLRGDRNAQFELYEQNKIFLFGVCMRYAKSKTEAEDILQEGFYRVIKNLNQFSGTSSFKAWMHRVMINSALMHLRKHNKVSYTEFTDAVLDEKITHNYDLFNSDRAQSIIALIRQLPTLHQTVFNMKAIDGYKYNEISEALGIKESTVRSHYLRARKKLQILLQHELH